MGEVILGCERTRLCSHLDKSSSRTTSHRNDFTWHHQKDLVVLAGQMFILPWWHCNICHLQKKKLLQQRCGCMVRRLSKVPRCQIAGVLPYVILARTLIKYPMVIFVQPRPGDPVEDLSTNVDVCISWYEDKVTTKITHSFYGLCQYVNCMAKLSCTFEQCYRLGKNSPVPSWLTFIFRLLLVNPLKINGLLFPRKDLTTM